MKQLVVAYVVLVVFAVAVAWLASRLRAVRRLDNRVLGERGIAAVAAVVASFLVAATVLTLARGVWGVAAVYAVMSGWVGYWTGRRFANLRRASR